MGYGITFEELGAGEVIGYIDASLGGAQGALAEIAPTSSIRGEFASPAFRTERYVADVSALLPRLDLKSRPLTNAIVGEIRMPVAALRPPSITPSVAAIFGVFPSVYSTGVAKVTDFATIDASFGKLIGKAIEPAGAIIGEMQQPQTAMLETAPTIGNYVSMWQSAGVAYSYSLTGYVTGDIAEQLQIVSATAAQAWPNLVERVQAVDGANSMATVLAELEASARAKDSLSWAWEVLAVSTAQGGDVASVTRLLSSAIVDTLVASGQCDTRVQAVVALVEAALIEDLATRGFDVSAASSAAAQSEIVERIQILAQAASAALLSDSANPSLGMVLNVDDEADLADAFESSAVLMAWVLDGGSAYVSIDFGDGEIITAWAMNPASNSFVEYRNYPFNSFAELDGEFFAASETGLYVLEGDDDNGESIDAWIRTAVSNIGASRYKRIESMYMGARADGQMMLKVISTSDNKTVTEDWYELRHDPSTSISENSYKPGKGIKSVYLGFKLQNVSGSYFEIDQASMIPIMIDRRF